MVDIEQVFGPPYTPIANPFVERVIGTTRREFLDKTLFWNKQDLEGKLCKFKDYYNEHRVHSGINGIKPNHKYDGKEPDRNLGSSENIRWKKVCNGLYQIPIAA